MGWLGFSGRCSRQQYWVMAAILFVSPMLAKIAHLPEEGSEIFWLILYGRRLHDFGKTLWWAVGVVLLSLVPVMLLAAIKGASFRDLIFNQGVDDSGHRLHGYFRGDRERSPDPARLYGLAWVAEGRRRGEPVRGLPRRAGVGKRKDRRAHGSPRSGKQRLWEDEEPWPTRTPPPPPRPPAGAPPYATNNTRYATNNTRPVFGRRPSS